MTGELRALAHTIPSRPMMEAAGVKVRRSLGSGEGQRHDPFLMLDEFFSDDPNDYQAGFPAHPHRGFETVTYMLDGHLRHEDHLGNQGELGRGGVQWMTAGRGIVHSEMPQQREGRMRGFQLWLNLPAREQMKPAGYRDVQANEITQRSTAAGGSIHLIAGRLELHGETFAGAVNAHGEHSTDPAVADLHLVAGEAFEAPLARTHNAFLYLYEGAARLAPEGAPLPYRGAALLGEGEALRIEAGEEGARLLLLAARPLNEPVVQYEPFVMNTRAEIEQALADYQQGRLTTQA